jgi:hypothetical protein
MGLTNSLTGSNGSNPQLELEGRFFATIYFEISLDIMHGMM